MRTADDIVTPKRAPPPRRKVAPPRSSREADLRWGLSTVATPVVSDADGGPGNAGEAWRGSLNAYTGEHYAEDVYRGVVRRSRRKRFDAASGRQLAEECPASRPELHCSPHNVPRHYRSRWAQIVVADPGELAAAPAGAIPTRERTRARVICFDCRAWLVWRDRQRFIAAHGEPGDDLDYQRRRYGDFGDQTDEATARAQAERDYAYVVSIAGEPEESVDWFEIRRMAEAVEHCTRMLERATAPAVVK